MGAVITLTTDFGLTDAYVAAMKGVVLSINPEVRLVDICHTIQPQNISQAAYVLSTAYEFFPQRSIHLVVVDPSVGTERRAVILRTPEADFVAPDNGVLSYVINRYAEQQVGLSREQAELGPGLEAVTITEPGFWRSPVSATFHGRDIFAPVAAHLSLGTPLGKFGEAIDSLKVFKISRPRREPDGRLVGNIIHIDGFGNLITSIRSADLPRDVASIVFEFGDTVISGLSHTFAEGKGLLALVGSGGYLEISLKEGSAGDYLGAAVGDEIRVYGKNIEK